ncbi:MAG: hypothetical protein JO035_14480 [Betaproteobacteria bacterium]|nr:hypothetical protein [Betaproteobacteria bacterium]
MAAKSISFRKRATAAAVMAALGMLASAQAYAQSADRLADQLVRGGLERGMRLPLEIIWLQSEIQADMWRNPTLAATLQGCATAGSPREGCAVSVRSAWRYTFDSASSVRPTPIVVSSLKIPDAPFGSGRLNLSGSGRVFLVTSPAEHGQGVMRPPSGAVVLAAGSTVQLIDAAYPSIQIEVKAPPNEPLFLGNLAAAEIGRIFSLLVPPGAPSAKTASVLGDGKVALRGGAEQAPERIAVASLDPAAISARMEAPVTSRPVRLESSQPLVASLALRDSGAPQAPIAIEMAVPGTPLPVPAARASALSVASIELSGLSLGAGVNKPSRALIPDAALPDHTAALETLATLKAAPAPAAPGLAAASLRLAERAEPAVQPVLPAVPGALLASAQPALAASQGVAPQELNAGPALDMAVALAPAPAPIKVAAAVPVAPTKVATAAPAASSDLARMRAEIEAEVARENERFAQALRNGKGFRFGT